MDKYFKLEIDYLSEMIDDGLVEINETGIVMTEIGRDFSQNVSNVFDKSIVFIVCVSYVFA